MTNDKTVTMSRELAEQWLVDLEGCTAFVVAEQLRAMLAAPVVERQGLAGFVIPGEMPVDSGYTLTLNPVAEGKYTKPLYASPPAPVADKYDDVLTPFVAMMRKELHANAGKGDRPGWLSMDRKTALLEIFYHMGKLQKAVKNGDEAGIAEYAADVANMSMMLADICACLDKVKEMN